MVELISANLKGKECHRSAYGVCYAKGLIIEGLKKLKLSSLWLCCRGQPPSPAPPILPPLLLTVTAPSTTINHLTVMPPVEESVTSSFASKEPQDDRNPLWRFVTVLENNDTGGGNKLWQCNFCHNQVKSSYSRVRLHLLKIGGKGVAVCTKMRKGDL
ncbi:hypothetical protein P8452_65620 [Trifolium repens]|nr:hypothetical protein P8452_65620 [Trifolium repens]